MYNDNMKDERKLLNKLEKLLALSDSPNQHEAEAAMAMAVRLATLHNIDLSRVSTDQRPTATIEKENVTTGNSRLPITNIYTTSIIQKFFNVRILVGGGRYSGRHLTYIGKRDDINNAKFLYTYLNGTFLNLWHQYYRRNPHLDVAVARKCYFLGLFRGLYAKLESAKSAAEETVIGNDKDRYQIMIVNNEKALDNAMIQFYPKVKNGPKNNARYYDQSSLEAGKRDGAKINVHAGLENSTTHRISA
jgi:hypothetical protein